METKEIKKIIDAYSSKLKSIKVLVNTYKVELKGNAPNPLMVKIWKDEYGTYTHEMSYWITSKNMGETVYKSLENCKTEEAAVKDFIDSLMNYDPKSKNHMIEKNKNYHK